MRYHMSQLSAAMMSWVGWWVDLIVYYYRLSAIKYMKVKRMAIAEILGRLWLFSANKIKALNLLVNNQLNSATNSTHHYGR